MLYGKAAPRRGRKMGHFTCRDVDVEHALERALGLRERLTGRRTAAAGAEADLQLKPGAMIA